MGDIRAVWPLLHVRSIHESLRHYTERLGFEKTEQAGKGEELYWCNLERGGASFMLQQKPPDEPMAQPPAPEVTLYFVCDDVDALYTEFRATGLEIAPPSDAYYGMRQIFVPDPDGYSICFESPVPPS